MDYVANLVYVLILSSIGISVGVILKYLRIYDKNIFFKKPVNQFKFSYFCIGIALVLFEIAKFGVYISRRDTDPTDYIPIYISSYFMYLFIANGFTKKGSFCNEAISIAIYISTVILWCFMLATTYPLHNNISVILWHHDKINFNTWHNVIYHSISLVSGIIFLIVNPIKLDTWRGGLKGLVPLTILSTIAYFCSTFLQNEVVDAFGNYDLNIVTRGVYDMVGGILPIYNLAVFIIQMGLFIASYYVCFIFVELIPRLVKYLSSKNKKHYR